LTAENSAALMSIPRSCLYRQSWQRHPVAAGCRCGVPLPAQPV